MMLSSSSSTNVQFFGSRCSPLEQPLTESANPNHSHNVHRIFSPFDSKPEFLSASSANLLVLSDGSKSRSSHSTLSTAASFHSNTQNNHLRSDSYAPQSSMQPNSVVLDLNTLPLREAEKEISLSKLHKKLPELTPLIASRNPMLDIQAKERLKNVLEAYIFQRCSLHEHCNISDFDESVLEGLSSLCFLQALQSIEHFAVSVSPKIQKRSAYLMGILKGQESHWSNAKASTLLSGGSNQLLNVPSQLLLLIGQLCLEGNMLPSDFTPDVLFNLHQLPVNLALKSVSAFNSNKRIIAGNKGGIINRARFFLRLIQNVSEQNILAQASQNMTMNNNLNGLNQSLSLNNNNTNNNNHLANAAANGFRLQRFGTAPSVQHSHSQISLESFDNNNNNNKNVNPFLTVKSNLNMTLNEIETESNNYNFAKNQSLAESSAVQNKLQRQQTDSVLYTGQSQNNYVGSFSPINTSHNSVNSNNFDFGAIGTPVKKSIIKNSPSSQAFLENGKKNELSLLNLSDLDLENFDCSDDENLDFFSKKSSPTQTPNLNFSQSEIIPELGESDTYEKFENKETRENFAQNIQNKNFLLENRIKLLEQRLSIKSEEAFQTKDELLRTKQIVGQLQKQYFDLKQNYDTLMQVLKSRSSGHFNELYDFKIESRK